MVQGRRGALPFISHSACPTPTTAQGIQVATQLLMGEHGIQSTDLGAIRISVDDVASGFVKENRHPFMERCHNIYKLYTVLPSAA